jgi:putative copper resistance protein D
MSPLEDQRWAGGIMWAGGDLVFVIALILAFAIWLRHEEQEGLREDARLARRQAAAGDGAGTTGIASAPAVRTGGRAGGPT